MSSDIKLSRQEEIQGALGAQGLRMEHSLDVLDGSGHAIVRIGTGEQVADEDLSPEVITLAEEWTALEGPVPDEGSGAAGQLLRPLPDRVTFHVWHDGDSSVGLPGDRCTVEIDLRGYTQEDRREYSEQVRESLQASFGAIWDTRPKVMTADEIRAEEAWPDDGGKTWKLGDTAKFGKNNERDVQVFAGLFRYSGMGMGNYYSAAQRVEWTDTTEAQRKAKDEGVRFVYWDAEQAFDPAGYEVLTGDKYVSMSEQSFQWWRDQQAAWSRVASALHNHWSTRALDRGVNGVVEIIKTLSAEATAFREAGRPGPLATPARQPVELPSPPAEAVSTPGFVLAFPGASHAEGDELLRTLRAGGNDARRVDDETADLVLRKIAASAELSADDPQP